jgi:outer membrane autotransporter protein
VSIDYARARVDGYTERGDAALTLAVQRQKVSALMGEAGVEAHGEFTAGGLGVSPYLSATFAKQLDGSGGTVRFAGAASPTIVNSFDLGENSHDVYGLLEAGASFALGRNLSAQVQARGSIDQPGGDETSGFLGVKVAF